MNRDTDFSKEDWSRIERLVAGQCSEDDVRALEESLTGDSARQKLLLEYCQLHIDLSIDLRAETALLPLLDRVGQGRGPMASPAGTDQGGRRGGASGRDWRSAPRRVASQAGAARAAIGRWAPAIGWRGVAAAACLALAAAGIRLHQLGGEVSALRAGRLPAIGPDGAGSIDSADGAPYIATLVNVTNCRWDPTRSTADVRAGAVRPGQSLNLMEGVAEINSVYPGGVAGKFYLEGPLDLMMNSEGLPSLQYGKLSAMVTCDYDRLAFDTPLGRVVVSEDSSLAVSANANDVDLHVFSGSAVFEPWRVLRGDDGHDRLSVAAGASLRVSTTPAYVLVVERGQANEAAFVTQASMSASRLDVSDAYAAEIMRAKPLAYWRFDRVRDGLALNETGDRLTCRMQGSVYRRAYPTNHTAEFSSESQSGMLLSDETVDLSQGEGYSIEFWMKPSHCHMGAIFSLVKASADDSALPRHGVLIELVGPPGGAHSSITGRLRFLHRNPPGMDPGSGSSCYSKAPYASRKWQHVAAVKDPAAMKLYLDGELAAETPEETGAPPDLRVLMGQLYSFSEGPNAAIRSYIGELDEVALYDRPLSVDEVRRHYRLNVLPAKDQRAAGLSF